MYIELLSISEAFKQFNILIALGLLVFYLFVEALDSSLHYSLNHHKAFRSAYLTFLLYIMVAGEVVAFVSNYLYVVPKAVSAAKGSYLVVENEKKKRPLDRYLAKILT